MLHNLRLVMTSLLFICLPLFANATSTGWLSTPYNDHAKVRLQANDNNGDEVHLLLDIALESGWKTYWRSPGAGGFSPQITWQDPLIEATWYWPTPKRFDVSGMTTQGYDHSVTLPIILKGKIPATIVGTLTLPTCHDVCVLTDYHFTLMLSAEVNDELTTRFAMAMGKIPIDNGFIQSMQVSYQPDELHVFSQQNGRWINPQLFIDAIEGISFGQPQFEIKHNILYARVPVTDDWGDKAPNIQGKPISLVIADNGVAQQINTMIIPQTFVASSTTATIGFWSAILFALLGGLVLNLMPCVLPVLGIKVSHILATENRDRKSIRMQFLASWLGIIFSFLILALFMTILRLSGQMLGWGIQFQNPWFIGLMVVVTGLFSANLLGLFAIQLSPSLNNALAGHTKKGLITPFLEGTFATLLATPCSAPFLGTAVAFALAAPLPTLWGIFLALAVGMGIPWLMIAIFPNVASYLPKPGRWMGTLRLVLGVLMLMSCLWLLSLMTIHIGEKWMMIIGIILLIMLLVAIAYRYSIKKMVYAFMLCLLISSLLTVLYLWQRPLQDSIRWQPFSEQAINDALAQDKRVFIDITADWCVTCKVNKLNVIVTPDIQRALQQDDVIALQGDWTQQSEVITHFLRKNGRVAIPFNQIIGPGLPQGQTLPTLLTTTTLLETLEQARGH